MEFMLNRQILFYLDYYPFGMLMPNRNGQDDDYRYGFNGMEMDDEVRGTKGASYDFGARMYDSRIGRFLSLDPLFKDFASFSPYLQAQNNPICLIDKNGEAGIDPRWEWYRTEGTSVIKAVSNITVEKMTSITFMPYCRPYNITTTTTNEANKFKGLYVLAQRRMENGFKVTPPGNNPMNIKGSGDAGQINYATTEYKNGKKISKKANFAKFSTMEAGYEGYFNLLKSNFPNAHNALLYDNKTGTDFAKGLMKGKLGVYATNPNYDTEFKSMLKGVVSDYEKMYNNQLTKATDKVALLSKKLSNLGENNQNLSAGKYLKGKISELNSEIKTIKENQSELQKFKTNEGL